MGEPFLSCNFFFINLPLKLFNFNFMVFFPKKIFWFWILKKKNWLDRRKKYIPTWHFHSIIIQNFEEKKLFQHFANLIKIRSTHLLPILDLIIPPLLVTFFSATIDGRTLIFGHKLHIGMPYRGNHQIPTSCLPT